MNYLIMKLRKRLYTEQFSIYKDINGTQDKRNYDNKFPVQIKEYTFVELSQMKKNRKFNFYVRRSNK